jgi:tRNA C32,U32 (ribose-2'-O)-methylase TrmJ
LKQLEDELKLQRAQLAAKSAAENNMRGLQNVLRDVAQRSYISEKESRIVDLVLRHLRKETERHKVILENLEKYAYYRIEFGFTFRVTLSNMLCYL